VSRDFLIFGYDAAWLAVVVGVMVTSRQNVSEILRAVEAGEQATVMVTGRPVAQIVPIRADRWTTWERVRSVFHSPTDTTWDTERREFGATGLVDPWSQ
jgi:prevent-host-death family protein